MESKKVVVVGAGAAGLMAASAAAILRAETASVQAYLCCYGAYAAVFGA